MKSVPIPGQILRTSVFLGLTFDELVLLGSIPLVMMLPGVMIRQLPLLFSVGIGVVGGLGVVFIGIRAPEGQTPLEWAPAALRRRFTPDSYHIQPRDRPRDGGTAALDVVQTARPLETGTGPADASMATTRSESVDAGDTNLERPDAVLADVGSDEREQIDTLRETDVRPR